MRRISRFAPDDTEVQYETKVMYDTDVSTGQVTIFKRVTTVQRFDDGSTTYGTPEDKTFDLAADYTPTGTVATQPVLVQMPTENLAVTGSTPSSLTPPAYAKYAEIFVEDENIRWTQDGSAPADNNGEQERAGTTISLLDTTALAGFRALPMDNVGALDPTLTANLTVTYYNEKPEVALFARPEFTWAITSTDASPTDRVYSVSVSGNIAAVGYALYDSPSSNNGRVEIYRYISGSGWIMEYAQNGFNSGDKFGRSVLIAENPLGSNVDLLFIAAPDYANDESGLLYLYSNQSDGFGWQLRDTNDGISNTTGREMGSGSHTIGYDGDRTVFVGCPFSDAAGLNQGEVQAFYLNDAAAPTSLIQTTRFAYNDGSQKQHGYAVAWDGYRMLAPGRGSKTMTAYNPGSSPTTHTLNLFSEPGANSGWGEAMDAQDGVVVVGDWYDADAGSFAGAVYVYTTTDGNTYTKVQKIVNPSAGAGNNRFGQSVSFDGAHLIVGSQSNRGKTWIFEWNGTSFDFVDEFAAQSNAVAISGDKAVAGHDTLTFFGA